MSRPSTTLSRRDLVRGALSLGLLGPGALALGSRALGPGLALARVPAGLAEIERAHGGRLGVVVREQGAGVVMSHRADERFAMCSTFKLPLAAAVLARVDRGEERLDRTLTVTADRLVANSPITGERVGQDLSLAELCEAAMTTSDNCAANLLIDTLGGPPGLTSFLRGIGDPITRLDRVEPEMNLVSLAEGDERDTTTPAAIASTVEALTMGEALSPASRDQLVTWMRAAVTGKTRLRKSWPADWRAGDKTGTGHDGPTNDVAVAWPPGRGALVVSAYYDRTGHTMAENAEILARVGQLIRSAR